MSIIANPFFFGQATSYQIERSLRFNDDDTAYLNRTFGGAGSTTKFSFSAWVKRGNLSATMALYSANALDLIQFNSSNQLDIQFNATVGGQVTTTAVFRDPTAWQHILVAVDTTQATAANRVRVYVNGTELTSFATASYPALNYTLLGFNGAIATFIGRNAASNYYDGYLTEINVVDGTQCTPGNFGSTDGTTLAWDPKSASGFSYGTNGFYVNFSDNSNTTAATLGKDYSGNGNNWTPNNFSVTAGAGNDSLTDTPTNYGSGTDTGGVMRGNYGVLNALNKSSSITLSDGNLNATVTANGWFGVPGTIGVSSGSGNFYWEAICLTAVRLQFGLSSLNGSGGTLNPIDSTTVETGNSEVDYIWRVTESNSVFYQGANTGATVSAVSVNDIVAISVTTGGVVKLYKNNTLIHTYASALEGGKTYFPIISLNGATSTEQFAMNFGQRAFAYAPPTGFLSLCTQNMAEGSITTSGTFTGNASADGPVVPLNGIPTTMTINGNAVTFGTHADKLAMGFKLRTSSASYNTSGSNSYSVSATSSKFKYARAQANP